MMKIFLINLDKNIDRMELSKKQLDAMGVDYERVSAVYGKELSFDERRRAVNRFRCWCAHTLRMRDGEIGCALSHYGIYRRMIDENIPYACILEDDNFYCKGFVAILKYIESKINLDLPEVILLSNGSAKAPKSKEFVIEECIYDSGTYAYVLTNIAARNLLLENYPMHVPCDEWRRWVRRGAIRLYHAFPTVVMQMNYAMRLKGESNIYYKSDVADDNMIIVVRLPVLKRFFFKAKRAIGLSIDRLIPYKGARGNIK